jgi:hypothetical protein
VAARVAIGGRVHRNSEACTGICLLGERARGVRGFRAGKGPVSACYPAMERAAGVSCP